MTPTQYLMVAKGLARAARDDDVRYIQAVGDTLVTLGVLREMPQVWGCLEGLDFGGPVVAVIARRLEDAQV